MTDEFDKNLNKYRSQIIHGEAEEIRRKLASGAIAKPAKVRAANYALEEDERLRREGTFIFPAPPSLSFSDKLRAKVDDIWRDPVWSKIIAELLLVVIRWGWTLLVGVLLYIYRAPIFEWVNSF